MAAITSRTLIAAAAVVLAAGSLHAGEPYSSAAPTGVRPASLRAQSSPASSTTYRAVLDRYCVTCHNARLRTANLTLDATDVERLGADAEVWEKVARKLRTRAMPPVGRPRPDAATYDAFASWVETELDQAAAARPDPGRPAIQRLNRLEYANAVRDLLALDIDSETLLLADDAAFGFDNVGDALTVSPALLERYLLAAQKISRLAIGDTTMRPAVETYNLRRLLRQNDRMGEELPFGSRGGASIRHYFPVDGEYVLRVFLQRGVARGEIPKQLDVRLDGERLTLFTIGGGGEPRGRDRRYTQTTDPDLTVRFPAQAGTRLVAVTFVQRTLADEGVNPSRLPVTNIRGNRGTDRGVERILIEGPYDAAGPGETASRRQIFVCQPTSTAMEAPCARTILATLAERAYRRPVLEDEDVVDTLVTFYEAGRHEGSFDRGIQRALERLLVDPEFLFRVESDPVDSRPGTAYEISDLALASRLSFFLWSSIPDDELRDVARRGELRDPAVLERQVRRMLADPRSSALVNSFAAQWLYLRNLRAVTPDVNEFPEFDENLRDALQRETELFLHSQLREDRSLVELLTADYTFVNQRLAEHYQIPNVYGSHFRRVALDGTPRAGLLGQGSLLTVTSYATRTSPVLRGKWLLENILGTPPPPPPPNVPDLPERGENDAPDSVRARLEQHRENPVCATCHARMDPLGFALENFDAIGKWRTHEGDTPIDASGSLSDGTTFDGPAELRDVLVARHDEFVTTVTEKLLTYAIGRGVEYYDRPVIRAILSEAEPDDYRWSSIVLGIVKSTPFQMRMTARRFEQ